MPPDPKPAGRVRDPGLLSALHAEWTVCALCFWAGDRPVGIEMPYRLSLHHVLKHPRDDLRANLVMLCGDGTTGHHGLVEAHHAETCALLASYLRVHRPDTVAYLADRLGSFMRADDYLRRMAA